MQQHQVEVGLDFLLARDAEVFFFLYGGIAYLAGILAGLCLQGLTVDKQTFFGGLDGGHHAVPHYFDAGVQALYGRVVLVRGTQQALALNQHFVVVLYYRIQVGVLQADVGGYHFVLVGFLEDMALQVGYQGELYFVFGLGAFVSCLFSGGLAGIGRDVNHSCPLLEAGQLAFGGTQFLVDDADTLVDELGSLGGYFVLVVIAFLVIDFYQLVQEVYPTGHLAAGDGKQGHGGASSAGGYGEPVSERRGGACRRYDGSLNYFGHRLESLQCRIGCRESEYTGRSREYSRQVFYCLFPFLAFVLYHYFVKLLVAE